MKKQLGDRSPLEDQLAAAEASRLQLIDFLYRETEKNRELEAKLVKAKHEIDQLTSENERLSAFLGKWESRWSRE